MRHRKITKKLNKTGSHRRLMLRNLMLSFIIHEKITTTEAKAKAIKPMVEKLITLGKNDCLASRRRIISLIGSNKAATKILKEISPKYKSREGGYTRIIKIKVRRGDNAQLVQLSLV